MNRADSDDAGKVRAVVAAQIGSVSYFLKIDGIPGESQDKQHKDEIEVTSFTWGNANAGSQAGGDARESARVTFQDLQFTARASKAGPRLMAECASGKLIPRAVLTARKGSARTLQDYLKITLEDVRVASYVSSGSNEDGGAPVDTVSLGFRRIEVEYRELRSDGSLGATIKTGFDLSTDART